MTPVSPSFQRQLTKTVTTKRAPAISGGKRGQAVSYLSAFKCSPFDPVSEDVTRRYSTGTPIELVQAFCENGLDIREGDLIVYGTKEYPVRSVGDWEFRGANYLHMVLEVPKA